MSSFNRRTYDRLVKQGRRATLAESDAFTGGCYHRTVAAWYSYETALLKGMLKPGVVDYHKALLRICDEEKTYLWHATAYQRAMAFVMANE